MPKKTVLPVLVSLTALLVTIPAAAPAATHSVNQVGTSFQPDSIEIAVGDTVEWIWSIGSHTVTNGVDLDDPEVGTLFDAPLNSMNPLFSFTFNDAGTVPYFCRPHRLFGMTGVIVVTEPPTSAEEPNGPVSWARVKTLYR
jgi:plastocyanin